MLTANPLWYFIDIHAQTDKLNGPIEMWFSRCIVNATWKCFVAREINMLLMVVTVL